LLGLHVGLPWHELGGAHCTIPAGVQVPFWHVSPSVHAFASLHTVSLGFGSDTHRPVLGSHDGASTQGLRGLPVQRTGLDPMQAPFEHVSTVVQALPSSQESPFAFAGFEHTPVAGSQVPAVWHVSVARQMVSGPVHAPLSHRSSVVQALPSSHVVPVGFAGYEQTPVAGSHSPGS
jgi:hypothetical protein